MKANLLLVALAAALMSPHALRADTTMPSSSTVVQYTYDESGNRIRRAVKDSETNPLGIASLSDSTHHPIAVVSPNPTSGSVTVDVTDNNGVLPIDSMGLYNLDGTFIGSWGAFSGSLQIDLTPYPSGWYVLRLYTENTVESIKILKL
ncbi:MAG: T9SS type A sorting domain-containing protein [Muribaculum sp.]|nr:T9SS type A sorting domain-containing protein [Muribaculum sp.]